MKLRIKPACGRAVAVASVTCLVAVNASAQTISEPATDPGEIDEEIVVTATRTARPLLEAAAAVAVQNVADLQAKGFSYGTDEFRGVPRLARATLRWRF